MASMGDTFLLANRQIDNHFYIIISDPTQNPEQIVLANFTSWREDKDHSCVVNVGEHRYVTHRSCVNYDTNLITLAQFDYFLVTGHLTSHEPVSNGLLKRILAGAVVSRFIPLGNQQILIDQGLIDDE